jgi:hypothetical protein
MSQTDNAVDQSPRKKSTLFCSECEFEGRVQEYIPKINHGGMRVLVCPCCGSEIDKRPVQKPQELAEAD